MISSSKRICAATLLLALLLGGCTPSAAPGKTARRAAAVSQSAPAFRRAVDELDFSGLSFAAWDGAAAAQTVPERGWADYTIMIYMNGSDLEREHGAATRDLYEMLAAMPALSPAVNVVIFTGGTYRWQSGAIPAPECAVWLMEGGGLTELHRPGVRNMGDAGTLAGFLEFGMTAFPATRYGLILWDHGGGSIAGYGHDENFQDSCLTLLEMNYAFSRSPLAGQKLEFLGFDACLMATAEMAVVASDYARYLIASEDLEPGDGWNYSFLSHLTHDPWMDGAAVGRAVADTYMDFYRGANPGALTLSVTDLSAAHGVMAAMGALMAACTPALAPAVTAAGTPLAAARGGTKTFGEGTPRDSACDMVDVGDMADKLARWYPDEAAALRAALDRAVVYQRHNSNTRLSGLSCYYVYGGAEEAGATLSVYRALRMSPEYTAYLQLFAAALPGGAGQPQAVWRGADGAVTRAAGTYGPRINGHPAELYAAGATEAGQEYACPILYNGMPADLIVRIDETFPDGRVLGVRREEGYVIQKGLDPVVLGDVIALCRREGNAWPVTAQFTVAAPLTVTWAQG